MANIIETIKAKDRATLTKGNGSYATFFRSPYGRIQMDYNLDGDIGCHENLKDNEALEYAEILMSEGYEASNRFLGYHPESTLPVKRGDLVTIKKGTMVKTVGREPKTAGKTYTVLIDHVFPGQNFDSYLGTVNPEIVWAGPGGYWSSVDINDVI